MKASLSNVFQPTRPREARRCAQGCSTWVECVSTHAPTGGATSGQVSTLPPMLLFQPTRPREARPTNQVLGFTQLLFQPTRPREARHYTIDKTYILHCFNPRAHGRRDFNTCFKFDVIQIVSTHAPTGGATYSVRPRPDNFLFQPTRPREARPWNTFNGYNPFVFQPTRPREARRDLIQIGTWVVTFQPTRPREARLCGVS